MESAVNKQAFQDFLHACKDHVFSTTEQDSCPLAEFLQYTLDDCEVRVSECDYTLGTGESFPLPEWARLFSVSDAIGTGSEMLVLLEGASYYN